MYKIGKKKLWDNWDREYLGKRVLYRDDVVLPNVLVI